MKKYIIIPSYGPLYALRKVFGPQHGPVRKPLRVDVDIIKALIQQKPPIEVLEVHLTNARLGTYDSTCKLDLTNYDTENFDFETPKINSNIISTPDNPSPLMENTMNTFTVEAPVTVQDTMEIAHNEPEPEVATLKQESVTVIKNVAPEETTDDAVDNIDISDIFEDSDETAPEPEQNKHMTRAERRAAKRAEKNNNK